MESYIGLTQTTLKQRLSSHFYKGSIYDHFLSHHGLRPNKIQLQDNTTILSKATDRYRLSIKEALLISQKQPTINRQFETFTHTLKLFRNSRPTNIFNTRHTASQSPLNNDPHTHELRATTHDHHEPPVNLTNSPVSPSIQSRIDNLYQHTLNLSNNLQTPSIRRLRSRNIITSQP